VRNTEQPKKKGSWGALLLALLVVPGIYVGLQLTQIFRPAYEYETAVMYTMTDSIEVPGLVLFDETTVEGKGELGYLVEDGERVSAGTAIAEVYTDPTQSGVRATLNTLENQISLLQKSQNVTASQLDTLLSQRSTALYDLLDGIDRMGLERIAAYKDDYLLAQNKMQITTGAAVDFNARIGELQQQKDALSAALSDSELIMAPNNGYFINGQNAAVLNCVKDEVLALQPAALAQLLEQGAEQEKEEFAGKIITSYQWYFCGSCSLKDAERFNGLKKVSICFPGRAETVLPAVVEEVVKDEAAGVAKFTLRCEYIGADVLRLGQETAQIIFASYTGVRISTAAVHMIKEEIPASSQAQSQSTASSVPEDDAAPVINGEHFVRGVYVKYGNVARFRKIERLYENAEYILVPVNGKVGTGNEVRMYDEVVVKGTDLYDGKLL